MNYRHIYHAGNNVDIVKHAVQTLILQHLGDKDKGFVVLDTHAGVGLYDLEDARSLKTGEAAKGIIKFLDGPRLRELEAYYRVLQKTNPLWLNDSAAGFRTYPGSPLITAHMLRPQDRLIACELHPEDAGALRRACPAASNVQTHFRDGYAALHAFLPPPEKRGLVLIDPPYEQPDEFAAIVRHVATAWRRWPTGIYMIWYPVKDRPAIWKFHEALASSGISNILCAEFMYEEETRSDHLNGGGHIIINPPWQLEKELTALFPAFHKALATPFAGISIKKLMHKL